MARTRSPGRREALLAAGEHVFTARGEERATVEEVTAAAGMAKGTFYLYFDSKNDLLAALRQQFAGELAAAVAAQSGQEGQDDWFVLARQRLEAAADAFCERAGRHEVLFHGAAAGEASGSEADWSAAITGALTELIRAGSAAGAFSVSNPELTAVALFHAVYGLLHHGLHHGQPPDREALLQAAWEFVARALGADRVRPAGGIRP
jgi:AcrR family transcriptional regulator